jgi:hypothetical protein
MSGNLRRRVAEGRLGTDYRAQRKPAEPADKDDEGASRTTNPEAKRADGGWL